MTKQTKQTTPEPISLEDLAKVTGGKHRRGYGYGHGWTNGNQ
jgi:hypothetical protein